MERMTRKGFGFCLISNKSLKKSHITNRSYSVFFDSFAPAHLAFWAAYGKSTARLPGRLIARSSVSPAGFGLNLKPSWSSRLLRMVVFFILGMASMCSGVCDESQAEQNYQAAKAIMKGDPAQRDLERAYELMRVAAKQNHLQAKASLGYMLYSGRGVSANEQEGLRLLKEAADEGSPTAAFNYAKIVMDQSEGKTDVALSYMKKAADSDMEKAQITLAECYYFGDKGIPVDYKEALKYYERAAEKGNPLAENAVGGIYYNGLGVPFDRKKGTEYFQKAAEKGMPRAQVHLAHVYLMGDILPKSKVEALKWLFRANVQGEVTARVTLRNLFSGLTEAEICQALAETGLDRQAALNTEDDKAPPQPKY